MKYFALVIGLTLWVVLSSCESGTATGPGAGATGAEPGAQTPAATETEQCLKPLLISQGLKSKSMEEQVALFARAASLCAVSEEQMLSYVRENKESL